MNLVADPSIDSNVTDGILHYNLFGHGTELQLRVFKLGKGCTDIEAYISIAQNFAPFVNIIELVKHFVAGNLVVVIMFCGGS